MHHIGRLRLLHQLQLRNSLRNMLKHLLALCQAEFTDMAVVLIYPFG